MLSENGTRKNTFKSSIRVAAIIIAGTYSLLYAKSMDDFHLITVFNLIIHEAGHAFFLWAPQFIYIAAGSAVQIAIPLVFIGYFWLRGERWSASFLLFWLATNLLGVAHYAGDAQVMQLELLGGDSSIHDWNYLLSSLHLLPFTGIISGVLFASGIITILLGIALGTYFASEESQSTF